MELDQATTDQLIATALIVLGIVLARMIIAPLIRRANWASPDASRRWVVLTRNILIGVGAFALIYVWAEELRVIGLSLVAVAVAVAISGQDVIRSALASIVGATSRVFSVGDRIIVGDVRGYVVDHSLVLTKLLEIGSGNVRTGRVISIPNSRLLTDAIINETAGHKYVLHSVKVPVTRDEWQRARQILLETASRASEPYVEGATRQMEQLAREHALPKPLVEPFVMAKPTGVDTVELTVRVPAEAQYVWRVENEILEAWLSSDEDDS